MDSVKRLARLTGALYLLFAALGVIREFLFPAFVVPGDAAATAHNIVAGEPMYRLAILTGFATHVMFIALVASLYALLRDVDRWQARVMVLLVAIGVAIDLADLAMKFAPLALLSGADYLSTFTRPQLEALALTSLRLHGSQSSVVFGFWGLWLFPFGVLVSKSGFLPRILGWLLIVAGVAYLTTSVVSIGLPAYRPVVSRLMMPLYVGELPIVFWLLIKGVKTPQA